MDKKYRKAKPLAEFATKLLSPVVERRAGMTLDLLAAWPEIVGEKHAAKTKPVNLRWPRSSDDEPFQPATLVVACDGAHAVFFQHETHLIVDRLNRFFGFDAVERIRIEQRAMSIERAPAKPSPKADVKLDHIADDDLRKSLERLGRGVFSRGSDAT